VIVSIRAVFDKCSCDGKLFGYLIAAVKYEFSDTTVPLCREVAERYRLKINVEISET
jgi:hypothetical protein